MKIVVDGEQILELTEIQKKVILNEICLEKLDSDLKRRLCYILCHKYERCFSRLKTEWDQKLIANGVSSVPTDPEEYAKLVFSQPNYKDSSAREAESQKA